MNKLSKFLFLGLLICAPEDWTDASGTSCYEYSYGFESGYIEPEEGSGDDLCTDPGILALKIDGYSIANCEHCGCIPGKLIKL